MYENGDKSRARIGAITFYITSEKAVEEPWESYDDEDKKETEYLGRGAYGHLYLDPPSENALRNWPTVKADLLKWLEVREEAE